eukprot:jgi/Psemu1/61291/gm1.61291_g
MSNFTAPMVEEGVNVKQYFKNISHHGVHNGNAFYDLDFEENPHNIHLASPGERLHLHQLGCAKQAAETFRAEFLGNNTCLLGEMDRIASYYGAAVQRQLDCDFPRTNFLESIHTAKKEGNQKCEHKIDRRIYAIELLLGMEEFLKYAGTFHKVFKQDKKGVLNVDKMNHMYFHLSQYITLFGPPAGWDSAISESNHKTELKDPAKRTQQINGLKEKCKCTLISTDVLKFCCGMVIPAVGTCQHALRIHRAQEYDWENFQLDLLDQRGLQISPCQILCLLYLEDLLNSFRDQKYQSYQRVDFLYA